MEGIEEITLQITDELLNVILAILSSEVRLKQVNVAIRTNETECLCTQKHKQTNQKMTAINYKGQHSNWVHEK